MNNATMEIQSMQENFAIDTFLNEFNYFKRDMQDSELVTEDAKKVFSTIKQKIKDAWARIKQFFKDLIDKVVGFFKKLFSGKSSDDKKEAGAGSAGSKIDEKVKQAVKSKPVDNNIWQAFCKKMKDQGEGYTFIYDWNDIKKFIDESNNILKDQYQFYYDFKKKLGELQVMVFDLLDAKDKRQLVDNEKMDKLETTFENMGEDLYNQIMSVDEKITEKFSSRLSDAREGSRGSLVAPVNIDKLNKNKFVDIVLKCDQEKENLKNMSALYKDTANQLVNFFKNVENTIGSLLTRLEKELDKMGAPKDVLYAKDNELRDMNDNEYDDDIQLTRIALSKISTIIKSCPVASKNLIRSATNLNNTINSACAQNKKMLYQLYAQGLAKK